MLSSLNNRRNFLTVLWICAVLSTLMTLIPLRNTIFSCDDSISNFVYGRLTDSHFSFKTTFEFSLMRGKVGILFPIVITIRDYLYRNGNFVVFWLMQYVPVYANVLLASYFVSKKLSREAAPLFVILFSSLLQVNGWHSLITCYPVEFMYGLFMELIGIILFDSYLVTPTSRKLSILKMAVSVICFYEAMQTYEAFLLFGIVYAFLSFYERDNFKDRIKVLIPHAITGIIYVGIFIYLNINPVVASNGYNVTTRGNFGGFILTDLIFAFGMFPLTNIVFPSIIKGISLKGINLVTIVASLSSAAAILLSMLKLKAEEINTKKYMHAGIIGLTMALIFPMMHSMTLKYQEWAIKEHQFGYVPSTISYFGWVVFILSLFVIIYCRIITKKPSLKKIAAIVITALMFMATLLTCLINDSIKRNGIGPTSQKLSYRAQSMFALASSDEFSRLNCDLLYVPDFSGVHGMFIDNEYLIQYETSNDVLINVTNDEAEFLSSLESASSPLIYRYFYDQDVGVLIVPSDADTGVALFIVSSHGFNGGISVMTDEGEMRQSVKLKRGETLELTGINSFDINSLVVTTN